MKIKEKHVLNSQGRRKKSGFPRKQQGRYDNIMVVFFGYLSITLAGMYMYCRYPIHPTVIWFVDFTVPICP